MANRRPGRPLSSGTVIKVRISDEVRTYLDALKNARKATAQRYADRSSCARSILEDAAGIEHRAFELVALLEELRAAGLELVAEAPFDRLHDQRRSIEEVNIAGLAVVWTLLRRERPGTTSPPRPYPADIQLDAEPRRRHCYQKSPRRNHPCKTNGKPPLLLKQRPMRKPFQGLPANRL